jgi:hypothetical protein
MANKKLIANSKEQKASTLFPRIYRFITERNLWVLLASIGLIALLVLIFQNLQKAIADERQLAAARSSLNAKIQSWRAVVQKYPDYRDGYFTLATLEYQKGDIVSAGYDNKKALALDANFKQGLVLERLLQIRQIERW